MFSRSIIRLSSVRYLSTTRSILAVARDTNPAGVFHKDDFVTQDPYPLNNRNEPYAASSGPIPMSEDLKPHDPIDRSHESTETKRARLLWQSRKRGILETDLLLSTFAAKELQGMNHETLVLYDSLLDEPDWEIYYYATGKKPAPEKFKDSELMRRLVQHVKNEERETRSMPSLRDQSANYRADKATDGMQTRDPEKEEKKEDGDMEEKLKKEDRDPSVIAS